MSQKDILECWFPLVDEILVHFDIESGINE